MAQQLRFSALTLFLILLGVILIGFLLHRTWESFMDNSEGFSANYGTVTEIASVELNGKYSTDNSTTAKLVSNLFFDPTNKALINVSGDNLYIKRKDGTDISYNTTLSTNKVTDLSLGEIIATTATDLSYIRVPGTSLSALTVGAAKTYFSGLADTKYIYMDIALPTTGSSVTGASDDAVIGTNSVRTFFSNIAVSPSLLATKADLYPTLSVNTNSFRKFNRTIATSGMAVSGATTTTNPVAFGWKSPTGLGVISVPLFLSDNKTPTNTTFIHIMDMNSKKHVAAYYFQGSAVEKYSFASDANIVGSGKTVGTDTASTTTPVFSGNIASLTYDFSGTNIQVSARHDISQNLVYIGSRVGDNMFRAYIKIDSSMNPVVVKSETGYETGSTTGSSNYGDNTSTDLTNWTSSDSDSGSGSSSDTFTEITKALNLIKTMQSIFGSQDSNYLLKTEVVPPVCPTCPSCSSSSGVCTNCGGNGGCGTQTTDTSGNNTSVKSIVNNGVGGVTDIGRDAIAGTAYLGKSAIQGISDVASGTGNFLKDSGSGIGQFAKDSGSGIGQFAKDSASGVYGATKDIGSGAYGATKDIVGGGVGIGRDIVGGGVGIGRDIVGGVGGMFNGGPNGQGGYQNSYGGPQYNNTGQGGYGGPQYNNTGQGYNQGGYLQPKPSTTPGQDPYSYYGTLPPREGGSNYIPITANFSSFGK